MQMSTGVEKMFVFGVIDPYIHITMSLEGVASVLNGRQSLAHVRRIRLQQPLSQKPRLTVSKGSGPFKSDAGQ